jgi:hypothetical protein
MKNRVALVVLQVLLMAVWAQAQIPAGGEFRVNTSTTENQIDPAVALGPGGGFLVAWQSSEAGGIWGDVMAQSFDAEGAPLGSEFRVNTFTTMYQIHPSVASDAAGNYVVAWESDSEDGDNRGVFARRVDAFGAPLGPEFRVNTYTTSDQMGPSVASDAAGNFVITWRGTADYGPSAVFGQRFDASGIPRGSEFRIGSGAENQVRVASDASGAFVVVWQGYWQGNGDGSGSGILARRYDAAGAPRGSSFRVNTYTTHDQVWPFVASDPAGNFIVTWYTWQGWPFDVPAEASGQRYDTSGVAVGSEFRIGSSPTFQTWDAVAAFDDAGDFVVTWTSDAQDGSQTGIFARRYDASGAPRGASSRSTPSPIRRSRARLWLRTPQAIS